MNTMGKHLFTPRLAETNERLRMYISLEDMGKFTVIDSVVVTDVNTGQQYLSTRADCGQACKCDAIVVPVQ